VVLAREYLKSLCASWFVDNFPGFFSSGYPQEAFPTCELITLEKHIPYQKVDGRARDNFLSMLELASNFDAWQSDELEGLFLQLPEGTGKRIDNLILSGNTDDILTNKDLAGYGQTREGQILNYLSCLDTSLGIWVLFIVSKTFERHLTQLRDSYGELDIDSLKDSVKDLVYLDKQVLGLQKDAIPFIHELKDFCSDETYCMHDVIEFSPIHESRKKQSGLFKSMRETLMFRMELLDRNERLLRDTADASRQIAYATSSYYLAQTNISLQRWLIVMTLVILLLTAVLVLSEIPATEETSYLEGIVEWLTSQF
jgi:hypothetical protein